MLTLEGAETIVKGALAEASRLALKPLAVIVLDGRGALKAASVQDGTSLLRAEVAEGKAYGALAMGLGSRALFTRAQEQPYFMGAVNGLAGGRLVPVPGGVLVRRDGQVIGAVGVSGDTSDNDEAAALAGIKAAGLTGDAG